MLSFLSIRNIVLIEKIDIDFNKGLCVLTGETGAGKSIILDSLGLVLGNRANYSLRPKNTFETTVSAVFSNRIAIIMNVHEIVGYLIILIKSMSRA